MTKVRTLTIYDSPAARARGEGNTHQIDRTPPSGPWLMVCTTRLNMRGRDTRRWPYDTEPRPVDCSRCLATLAKRAQEAGHKASGLPRRPAAPTTRAEANMLVGKLRRTIGACRTADAALEIGRHWLFLLDTQRHAGEYRSDREAVYDAIVAKVALTWHPTTVSQHTTTGTGTLAAPSQHHRRKAA